MVRRYPHRQSLRGSGISYPKYFSPEFRSVRTSEGVLCVSRFTDPPSTVTFTTSSGWENTPNAIATPEKEEEIPHAIPCSLHLKFFIGSYEQFDTQHFVESSTTGRNQITLFCNLSYVTLPVYLSHVHTHTYVHMHVYTNTYTTHICI